MAPASQSDASCQKASIQSGMQVQPRSELAGPCAEHFTCVVLFNPYNSPRRVVSLLYPFHREASGVQTKVPHRTNRSRT